MVEYKCINCKKVVTLDEIGSKAKCPYCSSKILIKLRPKVVKLIKAR